MIKSFQKNYLGMAKRTIGVISLLILGVELLIMLLIEGIFKPVFGHDTSLLYWELLDPVLLTMLVTPVIFVLTIRPLEQQQATLQMHFNELSISAVTFESQDGVIVTDANNRILRVNRSFTEITGYSDEEAIGKTPVILRSGRHDREFYRDMWNILRRDRYWSGEIWNRRKNGEIYPE